MSTLKTVNVQHPSSSNANLALDNSGNVAIQAGTVSAPAIYVSGDSNTGIYSPGANSLGFTTDGTQRGEFDASGNFKFNSGYGSVATAYGCRAWVNFDGTSNSANLSGTYSQSGTTVTVTATAHGLIAGNSIYADATSGTAVDGTYTVATVTDANTFTYTAGTSLTTSGNITIRRNTIRGSGNVSSVTDHGTGDYTVNFDVAMPDTNYAAVGMSGDLTLNLVISPKAYSTSSFRLIASTASSGFISAGTRLDHDYVNVAIFR